MSPRGETQYSKPTNDPGRQPASLSGRQESNQSTNLLHTQAPTSLHLLSSSWTLFLFSGISFSHLFLPYIFALYIHLFLICLVPLFFNHLPRQFFFFFFPLCPSAKWVGLQGYNHTRLIAAAKTSMAARAPATV